MGEGWWGGAESLILSQLKLHPFPGRTLAEAVSMTHVVLTGYFKFYFYEPLSFQIFVT